MPAPTRHPDRRAVAELIEELRDEALDLAPDTPGIPPEETVGAEAAQTLEEFEAALSQIAIGTPDPQAVASEALSLAKPLNPPAEPDDETDDPIRKLLKPRRS